MKKLFSIAVLGVILTGCSSLPVSPCIAGCFGVPVGNFIVCVGKCTIKIKATPPAQSAAEKAGAVAGGLLNDFLKRGPR